MQKFKILVTVVAEVEAQDQEQAELRADSFVSNGLYRQLAAESNSRKPKATRMIDVRVNDTEVSE